MAGRRVRCASPGRLREQGRAPAGEPSARGQTIRAVGGTAEPHLAPFLAPTVAWLLPHYRGRATRPRSGPATQSRASERNAVGQRADRRRGNLGAGERGNRRPVPDDPDRDRLSALCRAADPLLDRARLAPERAAPRPAPRRRGATAGRRDAGPSGDTDRLTASGLDGRRVLPYITSKLSTQHTASTPSSRPSPIPPGGRSSPAWRRVRRR